ncbi:MAG: M48 family metallopeptidase [Bacteroidales bacterium]|jgi:predicted Zn-dependent protease|nr:M48 family metallopeptidase [Bacteroidales bacterium]
MKSILFASAFVLLWYGCSSVPVTGRRQLSIVPASEMNSLAITSYKETLSASKLSTSAEQTAMIKRVGARISKAVEQYMAEKNMSSAISGFQWEFNLIDDPNTVNAWCMPGGKVAFYTGILPVCRNDAGVAVVMGHEIAHAVANHSGERMSQELVVQMGSTALSTSLSQKPEQTQQLALSVYGVGSQVLGILPYSRLHESEADKMGLVFMAMAGYDPNEAPEFWERMKAASGSSKTPQFLSTHPSDSKRINDLQAAMTEAMKYYKPQ